MVLFQMIIQVAVRPMTDSFWFRRKVQIETSVIFTSCELCSQSIELFRRRLARVPSGRQLPFANRVHHFHARKRTPGRPKRFEPQHGAGEPFHRPMVLFHNIIEIFRMADNDGRLISLVVVRNRRRIRAAFIDRDFLR